MRYDSNYVRQFYDVYGEKEWYRLQSSLSAQVNFHLHQHYLLQYVQRGQHVLEAGAGAGRFTLELAWAGARVTVLDISPEQLRLNKQHVLVEGAQDAIAAWVEGDILDLSRFPDAHFDAVVCYGGPLSYLFDKAEDGLKQMLRVLKPGGHLLLSVMSLLGTNRHFLASVVEAAYQQGLDKVDAIARTGNLHGPVSKGHNCHMYRWSELKSMLEKYGTILAASASGFLSLQDEEALRSASSHLDLWGTYLQWELDYCQEPGAIDGGTHIIAVIQKSAEP